MYLQNQPFLKLANEDDVFQISFGLSDYQIFLSVLDNSHHRDSYTFPFQMVCSETDGWSYNVTMVPDVLYIVAMTLKEMIKDELSWLERVGDELEEYQIRETKYTISEYRSSLRFYNKLIKEYNGGELIPQEKIKYDRAKKLVTVEN